MTAETAPRPDRQVRAQGAHQQTVRYCILLAALARVLLHDRRFHVTVIAGVIGTVALADLIKNNQARPVRRAVHWYTKAGASRELARVRQGAHQELVRTGQALERDKRG
jgi:hypothetical protein